MARLIEASTLRILNPSGKTVGTGFLVAPNLAVTCAHVVTLAGGIDGETIEVQFTDTDEEITVFVDPACWRDVDKGDVAGLRLERVPPGIRPLRLGAARESQPGSKFRSFGYGTAADILGIHANGHIDGFLGKDNLLQLQSPQAGRGISGAPVFDEARQLVVGMITKGHTELGRNQHTTFATPAEALFDLLPELKPNHKIENPFGQRGRIEDPTHYLVRQPLTDEIFNELRKGQSLSILGESQTGKSSLLWHIVQAGPAALERPKSDFVLIDLQLLRNDNDFYDCLCAELGLPVMSGFALGRALRGRQVVVCLDEIEKMTWNGFTHDLRAELRGLADGPSAPLTLVIASRSPLARLFPDSPEMTSPLAGLCAQVQIPPFSLPETFALIAARLASLGLSLPETAITAAHHESGGHPARLQQALQKTFAQHYG